MQHLPIETITTDEEFKSACKTYGNEAIKILEYMRLELKEKGYNPASRPVDREKCYHMYTDYGVAVQEISNIINSTTATFNL